MATLEVIKSKAVADVDRSPCTDDVLLWFAEEWSRCEERRSFAWDTVVPYRLGNLAKVEAILDKCNRPCFILEDSTRSVALAYSYADLLEHEARR